MGEQIFGRQLLVKKKKNRPDPKTNRQTFNGARVIFPLLHFQQQLYRPNMSLWHKRTPSGSVSLCLNCNSLIPWVKRRSGEKKLFARRACRLLDRNRKPRLAREERASAECPAVSMETSVTLQRMLSMLSRLNSEGRNKSKMA